MGWLGFAHQRERALNYSRKASKRAARKARKAARLAKFHELAANRAISRVDVNGDAFLKSFEWRRVRMMALKKYGARCQCCGATPADGLMMHVDHIKPRRIFPALALSLDNLQVLCEVCNHGKGNWDMTDWREQDTIDPDAMAHIRSM